MSPEQIECIRGTVAALEGQDVELGVTLADRLAVIAPETLRLLSPDPAAAGHAVLGQLRRFGACVTDFTALTTWGEALGQFTGTAVSAVEMKGIGEALLDTLESVLGPRFGPTEQEAWSSAVALVIELLRVTLGR